MSSPLPGSHCTFLCLSYCDTAGSQGHQHGLICTVLSYVWNSFRLAQPTRYWKGFRICLQSPRLLSHLHTSVLYPELLWVGFFPTLFPPVTHWKCSWAHWVQSASIWGSPAHLCWFIFIFWVWTTLTCFSRTKTVQLYSEKCHFFPHPTHLVPTLPCLLHVTRVHTGAHR